jgi:hypothetical protein
LNPYFQKIYDELEQQRIRLMLLVKDLPEEKFNHSPAPNKWSVAQILTHILTSEQLSLGYMRKKAQGIDQLSDSGLGEKFRFVVLKISQRIPPLKFKAPGVVLQHTPPAYPLPELDKQWAALRNELKMFLESIETKNVRKVIYKHPVADRFDAAQALGFFREHIIHHWPQIKRLL